MADAKLNIIIAAKDGASKALGGIKDNLQGIGTIALGVAGAGIGALGAGLAAVGVAAFGVSDSINAVAGDLSSQLGVSMERSTDLANIAADVWGNNFAGSIDEAGAAVLAVTQNMEELPLESLQGVTEQAFAISDAFGIDVAESTNTAGVLMNKFGLTGEQAMDLITTGLQDGLNKNDDFIDSISEYSNIFANAGFSAEQMYSIMATGAEGGVLGTDKISDAVKEMTIRLNEGGDDVSSAFQQIGMDFDQISGFVASGDENWGDYFSNIVSGLSSIEDPLERNAAQVAIFGTMAEDLGINFTDSLSDAFISLQDMEGAGASLNNQYNTLGDAIEGFKRQGLLAIRPIGDALLSLANFAMPYVQNAMAAIMPIVEAVSGAFGSFVTRIQNGFSPLSSFVGLINQLASIFGLPSEQAMQLGQQLNLIVNTYIPNFITSIQTALAPVLNLVTNFVSWKDVLIALGLAVAAVVIPAIVGLVVSMAPILLTIGAVIAAVALLRNAWEQNWGDIQGKTAVAVAVLQQVWQNVLLPAIQSVWQWLQNVLMPFITGTLVPWLQTNIPLALETLRSFWVDTLLPGIQTVWGFIQNDLIPLFVSLDNFITAVLSVTLTTLQGIWQNVLLPAITAVWGFISQNILPIFEALNTVITNKVNPIVQAAAGFFGGLGDSIGGLSGIIGGIIGALDGLANRLANMELPDWMTPGSPTPWENGLRGVGDAMNQLNRVSLPQFQGKLGGLSAPAVAGAGGGGQSLTVNVDARGAQRGAGNEIAQAVRQELARMGFRADARTRTR